MDLDPGYEVLTEVDIVTSVVTAEEEESSDKEKVMEVKEKWTYIDALIDYSTYSQLPEMAHHYGNFRMIRELIIKEQHIRGHQTKISSFFDPHCSVQDGAPASHFPSLLDTPPAPKDCTNADPCCRQHIEGHQTKISSFFGPHRSVQDVLPLVISHLSWTHLLPLEIALMLSHVVVSA